MRRREFVGLVGGIAATWPLAARAQQRRVPVIGYMHAGSPANNELREAFEQGLAEGGYLTGQNVEILYRWAEGHYDRLPAIAAEFVSQQVDLIAAGTPVAARAAKQATTSIPIVFFIGGDPIKDGLVMSLQRPGANVTGASLARPGGNITGLTYFASDFAIKRIEQIKEIKPTATQVAFLTNPDNPALMKIGMDAMEAAAKLLNITFQSFQVRSPAEFDAAFSAMINRGFDSVAVDQDGMLTGNARRIAAIALERRLAAFGEAPLANAGGLLGYGPNYPEMFRQAAHYVDRILKGANPAELPVQRPAKFELAINLKTAKILGLEVPPMLFARADEVIE